MLILLTRFNVQEPHVERFLTWYREVHVPEASGVPGIDSQSLYEAVHSEGRIWTYRANPRFTILSHINSNTPILEVVESHEFLEWWRNSVLAWSEWTADARWTVYRQEVGPTKEIAHNRILLTQEDVAVGHENAWITWYETKHLTDAAAVPFEFGRDYRRFKAVDVAGRRWRCAARPTFSHLFEVLPDVDLETVMASSEFEAMASDTMANWSPVLDTAVSTMCKLVSVD